MDGELRCKKCGGSQTRFRMKTKERVCYSCGHVMSLEETNDAPSPEDKE